MAAIQVLSVEDGPCSWAAALAPNVTAKHPVQIEATLPAADSNGTAHLVLTRPNGQQFGCDIEISAKGGTKWKVVQGGSCDISGEGVTMTLSPSAGTIRAADDSLHLDVNGAVTASWGMLSCDGKASIVGP